MRCESGAFSSVQDGEEGELGERVINILSGIRSASGTKGIHVIPGDSGSSSTHSHKIEWT